MDLARIKIRSLDPQFVGEHLEDVECLSWLDVRRIHFDADPFGHIVGHPADRFAVADAPCVGKRTFELEGDSLPSNIVSGDDTDLVLVPGVEAVFCPSSDP
jgi:hypothetical protein